MEVNISDLTWNRSIYPRKNKSDKTISSYVEALEIGAQFPLQIRTVSGLNRPWQKNSGLSSLGLGH